MKPLVSVCVQTYNHRDYITECLNGILMQETNFPFEVLLGEDESNDGTRQICNDYAKKYPDKINLFLRNRADVIYINGNPTGRFNMIENLKAAKGKYIAFCEGDDFWTDPLKLQKQIDLLESNTKLIACHHWQTIAVKKEGVFVEIDAPIDGHGYFSEKTANIRRIFSNDMRVKSRTLMFRNIIDENFFPDWLYKVAFGDVPLSFLLGKYGDFGFIDESMAAYRQTDEGLSKIGLKEFGKQRFTIQHFKNWIEIWDFADKHYKYEYHKEASMTVNGFFKTIMLNLPISVKSLVKVLWYNICVRKIPIHKSISNSKWILFFYIRKIGFKVNRKFKNI